MMPRTVINSLSSDTAIIGFNPGTYQVVMSSATTYLPSMYGTLTVMDSGNAYKCFLFVSTYNTMYYRVCHKNDGTWYSGWVEVATTSKITAFAAIGATSGTKTDVEIQLPSNAMFSSSQPLFMIASFRGSTSNENEGYAIIKIDNGVVYVTNKSGIQTLSNLAYNSSTKKLTFTSGTYITFVVFGLALS